MEAWESDGFIADLWAWQREVLRALERLERMLSRLPVPSDPGEGPLALPAPRSGEELLGYREPDVDVVETPGGLYLTLEMPGVDKEEIDLTVAEDLLTVRVDSPRRRYYREIPLPPGLDLDRVEAAYRNGVLDIAIAWKQGR